MVHAGHKAIILGCTVDCELAISSEELFSTCRESLYFCEWVGRHVCNGDDLLKFYAGGEMVVSGTSMSKHFPGENEIFHK
jgi:hypothetical protein